MDVGHVERLRRARDLLAVKGFDTRDTVLSCYSGAGFSPELKAASDTDIRLIGLDQIYAERPRLEQDLHGASLLAGFLVMAVALAARRVPVRV